MISHCGMECDECAAFKATREDNDDMRKEVALKWSEQYKSDIKMEDINCEGCLSDGTRVFNYCNICEIRECGIKKGVPNCAHCQQYICDRLDKFLQMVPGNRDLLEQIRNTGPENGK